MSSRRVLVDTGPLVSIFDPGQPDFAACSQVMKDVPAPLLTCWPVITEALWLLRSEPAAQQRLLDGFNTGFIGLLRLDESDVPAVMGLFKKYASARPELADLCLVRLANREGIRTIFTLDRRDFSIYRYRDRSTFHLLPD